MAPSGRRSEDTQLGSSPGRTANAARPRPSHTRGRGRRIRFRPQGGRAMSQSIRTTARSATLIDTLESRTLLNGSFGDFHFFQPPPLSDAVKADLATTKAD